MCRDCNDLTMVCWAEFERQHEAEQRAEQLRIDAAPEPVQAPEQRHEAVRLFTPAPTQLEGQLTL